MQIVILAGGLGTRLKPLTDTTPKSLVPINGIPFIHYQLERLIKVGFSDIIFALGHLSKPLMNYLDTLTEWRKYFQYSVEDRPLGTGGALLNLYSKLDDNFIVLNGDNIWLGNYQSIIDYYIQINSQALIVLRTVKKNGNVKYNPNSANITHYARECYDCMYEDVGVKMFNKRTFSDSTKKLPFSLEDNIYKSLIQDNILKGVLSKDKILDIGTIELLKKTEKYISGLKE